MQFAPSCLDSAFMAGSFNHFGYAADIRGYGNPTHHSAQYDPTLETPRLRKERRLSYTLTRRLGSTHSRTPTKISNPIVQIAKKICTACLEEKFEHEATNLACKHVYCRDCLQRSIESVLNGGTGDDVPLYCCGKAVPLREYRTLLLGSLSLHQLQKLDEMIEIHEAASLLYCPRSACSRLIHLDTTQAEAATVICPNGSCKIQICVHCRARAHSGGCKKDSEFSALVERRQWQSCPKCKRVVEKSTGCDEMVCLPPCNQRFCYQCGNARSSPLPCSCLKTRRSSNNHRSKSPQRLREAKSIPQIIRRVARAPCSWVVSGVRRIQHKTGKTGHSTNEAPFEERARVERLREARVNESLRAERRRSTARESDHENRQRTRNRLQRRDSHRQQHSEREVNVHKPVEGTPAKERNDPSQSRERLISQFRSSDLTFSRNRGAGPGSCSGTGLHKASRTLSRTSTSVHTRRTDGRSGMRSSARTANTSGLDGLSEQIVVATAAASIAGYGDTNGCLSSGVGDYTYSSSGYDYSSTSYDTSSTSYDCSSTSYGDSSYY